MSPEAFTAMDLAEPMRSQRADRLTYVQPPQEATAGSPGLPAACMEARPATAGKLDRTRVTRGINDACVSLLR